MKIINIDNMYSELWDLLGMFESKSYVKDKILQRYSNMNNDELYKRINIVASSVRQAREYFIASNNVSNLTSPLLVNYGMINLAKALYYVTKKDVDFNSFSKHGLNLKNDNYNRLSDIKLDIKESGAIIDLISCYSEKVLLKSISLMDLLAQIPELSQIYEETYNTYSKVLYAQPDRNGYKIFSTKRDKPLILEYLKKSNSDIFTKGIIIDALPDTNDASFKCTKCIGGDLSDNILKTNSNSTFINIEKKDLRYNQITISYIIIFSYSMLVRYQPNNWENLINNDFSKETQVIFKSIQICKEIFIVEVTKLLIGEDIKIITKTDDIKEELDIRKLYKKIREEAKRDAFVNNSNFLTV